MRTLLSLLVFFPFGLFGQLKVSQNLNIKKSIDEIKLDGILNETSWDAADIGTDFWMKFPTADTISDTQTEVKFTYDKKFLYIGIKAYESKPGYLVTSLKRDIGLRESDGVGIIIDPTQQQTNGFYFSVSPFNSQTEGLAGGGADDLTFTWDNKWFSATKSFEGYWIAEMAIPFDILRYDDSKKSWNFNIIRSNRKANEFSTLARVPVQFRGFDLGYHNNLLWDQEPPKSGYAYVLNPYAITTIAKENGVVNSKINAGADAKFSLSSSLNLDFTFNPDFSNVDVDNQVTNLTRFNIFFPERRVFFLENDDIFSSYGIPPAKPFYSRRIGSKDGKSVPIYAGARLTGNIAKNTRIGIMNIQTGRKGESSADNFTSLSLRQRIWDRSTISGYIHNRSAFMTEAEIKKNPLGQFGRNYGSEFNYSNKAGTINGWAGLHMSAKPNIDDKNIFTNFGGGYFSENFNGFVDFTGIGRNYYADMGFVNRVSNYDAERDTTIRVGTNFLFSEIGYTWYKSKSSKLNRIELETSHFLAYDDRNKFNERENTLGLTWSFKSTSEIGIQSSSTTVNLLFPFSFVNNDNAKPLPSQIYNYATIGAIYRTDVRKNFTLELETNIGKFYNADYQQFIIEANARKQPFVTFGLNLEYNNLKFPELYGGQENYLLIAPKLEWNFSNNLFWTTFLQYNTQADNFNINSRLQWRYTPMSDVFLVYSDDYITGPGSRNTTRGIAIKANYWLNSTL
jgi:hypothetical protein